MCMWIVFDSVSFNKNAFDSVNIVVYFDRRGYLINFFFDRRVMKTTGMKINVILPV